MDYRVEQLAAAAGVSVDTLRFYQARRLLPAPRRAGRHVIYGERHLARLRRIRELKRQGLPLGLIERMLSADGRGAAGSLRRALAEKRGEERYTRAELAAQSGVAEELIAAVEGAGLIEPLHSGGRESYAKPDVELARAALAVLREGFPLGELLALALRHAESTREVAERAADLFDRHVRRDRSGAERPEREVVASFERLLPAVTALVAHHFSRTLVAVALARLEERGESEALRAALGATRSGRLEVAWR